MANRLVVEELDKPAASVPSKTEFVEVSTLSARNLLKISTHAFWDPWPDFLVVDEIKVSAIYRRFFGSEVVSSLLINDISDVSVSSNPFGAAIQISSANTKPSPLGTPTPSGATGPLYLKALRKNEAAHARRLIMGLIILANQKVDTSKISVEALIDRAEELGKAQ